MKAIKESPKKTFPESVNYFTNPKGSWYPPAKNKLDFHYACWALPQKEPSASVDKATSKPLQLWSTKYTKPVHQRSVRQETTLVKSGIHRNYFYSTQINESAQATPRYELLPDRDCE